MMDFALPTNSKSLRPALMAGALFAVMGCHQEEGVAPPRFPAAPPPIPGAPAVTYRWPFEGTWRVQRTHYGSKNPDQAYAIDLVPLSNRGSATTMNANWPCYNQPVLSDAPGIVAVAVDGVPENTPGTTNVYDQHGNHVVIDHRNGEFSLFAHFIPGSLKVRAGQAVEAGVELGRCGNSGRSDFPHIHWQVMDNVNASIARGLIPRFAPYDRNGTVTTEMPNRRDTLTNR